MTLLAQFAATGGALANYIEDVFSTWLYTGSNSATTITNGIDLSTKGGLVWTKSRSGGAADNHLLIDTVRGVNKPLRSNESAAQYTETTLTAFNTTGYDITGANGDINASGRTYASWTLREQEKFFDVVTYSGTSSNQNISHNLGSVPGCIMIKTLNAVDDWMVYHRSTTATQYLSLNQTIAAQTLNSFMNNTDPTSTVFTVGTTGGVNNPGTTYVAYLFAHNAGGFGLTGTDNVISCGSYTGNGSTSGPTVTLGYEPQWLLVKNATTAGNWFLMDNMRGIPMSGDTAILKANTSAAEDNNQGHAIELNATGFQVTTSFTGTNGSGDTLIYIAIRRGPMKVPTDGTKVFTPYEVPASPTTGAITGFVTDAGFIGQRAGVDKFLWGTRLMGNPTLNSTNTSAESANTNQIWDRMNGWWNSAINGYMTWGFKRAPGFFDVVCYTGTGSGRTVTHNLGVAPEFMIIKSRNTTQSWITYSLPTGNENYGILNTTVAWVSGGSFTWNNTFPTNTVFSLGASGALNGSGDTYVAYLFATCAGVSKVGSYTGTGTTQTINCGFTAGSRFVMIKRTDSTGDWYVWDSARGIIAGNDPYLLLNSTAAEVTGTDYVDTAATGFELSSTAPAALNANGGTYIFLAIA